MTHEHDHDHHHHLVSVGDEMDGQEQGAENIDPATVKQISGFLLRGRAAFARLAELLPVTNARVASLSPDVACKASAAATLCNSVEQDLGFYCQLMGIDPQFAQGFPSEASEQYATHWIANIMPNIIQQVFSRGLNPVMITVQNPRNLE